MPKKVPLVMQMEAIECGAACLGMVLAAYGKWVSPEQVRQDCGISRDGSNAKNILLAARKYGLEASGLRAEPEHLRALDLPVILHWQFVHFVVLSKLGPKWAVIQDPAKGTVRISMEELDRSFTGIVLCFKPTDTFQKDGSKPSLAYFLRQYLQGNGGALLLASLLHLLIAVTGICIPLFALVFMDYILPGTNPTWLAPFLGIMAGTLLFQFFTHAMQQAFTTRWQGQLALYVNTSFLWRVLQFPVEFFAQRYIGDIVSRQADNTRFVHTLLGKILPFAMHLVFGTLYLLLLFYYSAPLALAGLLALVLNIFLFRLTARRRLTGGRIAEREAGTLAGITYSGFHMMETIKASGAENAFFSRWAGQYAKYANSQLQQKLSTLFLDALPSLVWQLTNISVLTGGVYLIMDSQFTLGILLAFQGYLALLISPVMETADFGKIFAGMRSQMERANDIMNYPVEPKADLPDDGAPLTGELELRHLTFGYNRLSPPLIEDFSMHLSPGARVALVGLSGSGKSTLAKLIAGLYKPWSGSILFDGIDQQEVPREKIVRSVYMVDQNTVLFEDTIKNNITMWDSSVDTPEMIAACKAAEIHEEILSRPQGYEHILTGEGYDFSGGQKQKIEIARALAVHPVILIFDEATSALDALTEHRIMENVKALGVTLLIIAHRLSTVRDCDAILVLDQGQVAEQGTHAELMEKNGGYARFIRGSE